jgi:hypothetical protein
VLRGTKLLSVALPAAKRMQEALTQPERESIRVDGLAEPLRHAVVLRWRLAAAQDLAPSPGDAVDQGALDALLAEVDGALESLRSANGASPELGLAIDRNWETLAREAVEFSGKVKAASDTARRRGVAAPAARRPAATAGKISFEPNAASASSASGRQEKRMRLMIAATALVVLAGGGFHLYNLMQPKPAERAVPGAPPFTMVVPEPTTGAMMVTSTRGGAFDEAQKAWLQQQRARGFQVKSVSPGSAMLVPQTAAELQAGTGQP